MAGRTAVVAIGGNSLIKDRLHQSVRDQYVAAGETCWHIASMIKAGWRVAITHGNGPQVGFLLRRSEIAAHELHEVPLDAIGADTQGAIGYALQQNLYNDFQRLGMRAASRDGRDADRGGRRRPGVRRALQARRLVHGRRDGPAARTGGRLGGARGRRARLAARRRVADARADRRDRRHLVADRRRRRGDLHRRRRHPGGPGRGRATSAAFRPSSTRTWRPRSWRPRSAPSCS